MANQARQKAKTSTIAETTREMSQAAITGGGIESATMAKRMQADDDNTKQKQDFRQSAKQQAKQSPESNVVSFKKAPSEDPRQTKEQAKTHPSDGGDRKPEISDGKVTSPTKITNSFNYSPVTANDNVADKPDLRNTANRDGQRDTRSIAQRDTPVIPATSLGSDAAANLPKGFVQDELSDPTRIRNKRGPEEEENFTGQATNDNTKIEDTQDLQNSFVDERSSLVQPAAIGELEEQEQRWGLYVQIVREGLAKEKIEITDQEILNLLDCNFHVKFPLLMFAACFLADLGEIFFGLTTIVLTPILLPGGFALMLIGIIEACMGVVIFFFWSQYYIETASELTKKVPFTKRLMLRFIWRRAWMFLFELAPWIGGVVPMKTLMVVYIYRTQKKISERAQEILAQARTESGI
jgi:hypothetical protein